MMYRIAYPVLYKVNNIQLKETMYSLECIVSPLQCTSYYLVCIV